MHTRMHYRCRSVPIRNFYLSRTDECVLTVPNYCHYYYWMSISFASWKFDKGKETPKTVTFEFEYSMNSCEYCLLGYTGFSLSLSVPAMLDGKAANRSENCRQSKENLGVWKITRTLNMQKEKECDSIIYGRIAKNFFFPFINLGRTGFLVDLPSMIYMFWSNTICSHMLRSTQNSTHSSEYNFRKRNLNKTCQYLL